MCSCCADKPRSRPPQETHVEQFRQMLEARGCWRKEDHGARGGHRVCADQLHLLHP